MFKKIINMYKNIYANHDHCGDIICKNPKIVRELIKNEIKYIKKLK